MAVHKIGTYNMSFSGDQGLDPRRTDVYESEGAFHLSNKTGDLRMFWKNALNTVVAFVKESNFTAIGLQDMNMTAKPTIEGTLSSIKPRVNYKVYIDKISTPYRDVGVAIIWNAEKLGDIEASAIYDLDYTPKEYFVPNTTDKQQGRPIQFLLTTGGYLLINLNAPNHEELARRKLTDLRRAIAEKTTTFMKGREAIQKGKMFVMGDFNDRYDAIKEIRIDIAGVKHILTYRGDAPFSCCHNWDGSCTDTRFTPIKPIGRVASARGNSRAYGKCTVPTYKKANFGGKVEGTYKKTVGESYALAGPPGAGPRILMGKEGTITNYRFTGDKIFGEIPVGDIAIYPPGRTGASKQSDHEAVAAEFSDAMLPRSRATRRHRSRKGRRGTRRHQGFQKYPQR